MDVHQSFKKALQHHLKTKKGGQTWLAKMVNIKPQQISAIINGKSKGSLDLQIDIAKAYKFEYIDFLLFGDRQIKIENGHTLNEKADSTGESAHHYQATPEPIKTLLDKTRTVLESDTHWSVSLKSNIESFHTGLQNDQEDRRKMNDPTKSPQGDRRRKALG